MAMAAEKTKKLTEREKVNRMEKMNWMVLELEKVLRTILQMEKVNQMGKMNRMVL
jgi:hypothetical protein